MCWKHVNMRDYGIFGQNLKYVLSIRGYTVLCIYPYMFHLSLDNVYINERFTRQYLDRWRGFRATHAPNSEGHNNEERWLTCGRSTALHHRQCRWAQTAGSKPHPPPTVFSTDREEADALLGIAPQATNTFRPAQCPEVGARADMAQKAPRNFPTCKGKSVEWDKSSRGKKSSDKQISPGQWILTKNVCLHHLCHKRRQRLKYFRVCRFHFGSQCALMNLIKFTTPKASQVSAIFEEAQWSKNSPTNLLAHNGGIIWIQYRSNF